MVPDDSLRDLDQERHLRDPSIKQRYVTRLFDLIAPRYDRFTRIFSYGMDRAWKRELMDWLAARIDSRGVVADLASGTGDFALAAGPLVPQGHVVGIDVSVTMSELARDRSQQSRQARAAFVVGDMMHLPLGDGAADAVTIGYGLRNTPDYRRALQEAARIVRPGGWLLTLDFYRPEHEGWRALYLRYLRIAGSVVGWLWHREPAAYAYIAASIERYVSYREFTRALQEQGFIVERERPKLGGGICLHMARRP